MSDPARHQPEAAPPRVLRIVDGRLAGKEYALSPSGRICIGHGLANDVVLRGAGTRDGTIELRISGDAAAVRVIAGHVELLGRTLAAGEDAVLPPYLPFRFGEFVLAHGQHGSDRWSDAASIATSPCAAPMAPLPPPRLSDRAMAIGREQVGRVRDRINPSRLAIAAVSIMLLAVAAGPVDALIEESMTGAASLSSRLERDGFTRLAVADNPAGGLIVSGMVGGEADLMRLRAIAADQGTPVMVDVTSSESMANAATDILQAQGLDAKAEPAGLAGIAINAPYLTADRQAVLSALLKRDLPGLKRVAFKVDDSRGGDPLQSFFANSGTGLASVIEDPGHIVTADGARWFPGAVLPTGHRLVSVGNGRVRFEKDGRIEDIQL